MQYKTYAQIKAKVERELDIEVEEFIQPDEFLGYVNDGIDEAESIIHSLGLEAKYFLTKAFFPLVLDQADYPLPSNIYSDKITAMTYKMGATIYSIRRLRGLAQFEDIERINQYNTVTDFYKFVLRNDSAAAGKILQLVPPARETSSQNVTMWYIRNANVMVDDTSICDLPEIAQQFLYQYVKYRCYEKEGHPNQDSAKADLDKITSNMVSTLENQTDDTETEIVKDLSYYEDMS